MKVERIFKMSQRVLLLCFLSSLIFSSVWGEQMGNVAPLKMFDENMVFCSNGYETPPCEVISEPDIDIGTGAPIIDLNDVLVLFRVAMGAIALPEDNKWGNVAPLKMLGGEELCVEGSSPCEVTPMPNFDDDEKAIVDLEDVSVLFRVAMGLIRLQEKTAPTPPGPIDAMGPKILYTDILSGPNTGGENNDGIYLSIFGTGFGSSQGSSKVFINNKEVAAYKYWGVSQHGRPDVQQISVQIGSGISTGAIKVIIDGKSSNTDHIFTVRSGDIYFVDNVIGNQSAGVIGDITKPFRYPQTTIGRSDFGPGDVMVMRGTGTAWTDVGGGGTSPALLQIKNKGGGTALNPYMVMGYPGEEVLLVASKTNLGIRVRSHWIVISNLHIDLARKEGGALNYNTAVGFRAVNVEAENQWGRQTDTGIGVVDGNPDNYKILGCYIHDNWAVSKYYHDFYIKGTGYEVAYCHVAHRNGNSLELKSSIKASIHHNVIHDIARVGINFGAKAGAGNLAYNNIIYNVGTGITAANSRGGLTAKIYNNTIHVDNGKGMFLGTADSGEVKNNIIYATGDGQYYGGSGSDFDVSNNLWYGKGPAPSFDTNPINQDPQFVNVTDFDFHLQSSSPAIDSGMDIEVTPDYGLGVGVRSDYDGNPRPMDGDDDGVTDYDIGAYEYAGM